MTTSTTIPDTQISGGERVSSQWFGSGSADRVLNLFTALEPGEGLGALLLAANVFLLLSSYYILKTVREALILTQGGAEVKTYAAAGQAALLLAMIPIYGWMANRLTRFGLITTVTLFFVSNLPVFYVLDRLGIAIGVPFYLWLGIFNLMALAQFWAFANDLYTEEQGKRLFPILGIGSSLGALAGAQFASRLFSDLGVGRLMLLAALLIIGSVSLAWLVNRRASEACEGQRTNNSSVFGSWGGFELVSSDRYLGLIAVMVILLNVVNTGGEFLLSKLVVAEAVRAAAESVNPVEAKRSFIGSFYGTYFTWIGLGGLLLQSFLVSRLFRWIGVRGALFLLPVIALGGYSALAAAPVLAVAVTTKLFENAIDYSVENTARNALFLPVSREAKYKAKTVIDTFFYRTGDMTQAGVVWAGTSLAFGVRDFALTNVVFILVWLIVTYSLLRHDPASVNHGEGAAT